MAQCWMNLIQLFVTCNDLIQVCSSLWILCYLHWTTQLFLPLAPFMSLVIAIDCSYSCARILEPLYHSRISDVLLLSGSRPTLNATQCSFCRWSIVSSEEVKNLMTNCMDILQCPIYEMSDTPISSPVKATHFFYKKI